MTTYNILDLLAAGIVTLVLVFFWDFGHKRQLNRISGWLPFLSGLMLLLFGFIAHLISAMVGLDRVYIIANINVQTVLSQLMGFLPGLILITYGLLRIINYQSEYLQSLDRREKQLQASEHRYRSFIANNNDGIWRYDLIEPLNIDGEVESLTANIISNGRLVECNQKFVDLHGYDDAKRVIGKSLVELDGRREVEPLITAFIRNDFRISEKEVHYQNRHGKDAWCSCSLLGTLESGKLVRFWGTQRDITQRKRAEHAIRKIAVGVSTNTGTAFFTQLVAHVAKTFQVQYVFIGLLQEDNNEAIETVATAVGGRIAENFSYSLKNTPCENVYGNQTCFYPTKVQRLFPRDTLLQDMNVESYLGTPLFDSNNNAMGLLVVMDTKPIEYVDDIKSTLQIFAIRVATEVERKRAADELQQHKKRLEWLVSERNSEVQQQARIIRQVKDLIAMADLEGNLTYINPGAENLLGYTSQELVGKPLFSIHREQDISWVQDSVFPCLLDQGSYAFETRLRHKDGHLIDVYLSMSVLTGETGDKQAIMGYGIDISERKKTEKRLKRQTRELAAVNKELEAFSYSVSHDLRAPLRGIDGFSALLEEEFADTLGQAGRDYLERVRENTHRMAQLIDDLLQLSRVSRGSLDYQTVDLSEMAQEVVKSLKDANPQRRCDVDIQPQLTNCGDATLLRMVLDNLLGNAWKYTGKQEKARIAFRQTHQNGEKVYCVNDNGAGFDMNYADKLFGVFQRLHGYDEFEGIGVGLATVQRIIHRHGGKIWAEGETGRGATFYFTLPSHH